MSAPPPDRPSVCSSQISASPDPAVRDDRAYVAAVRLIPTLVTAERRHLGDRMAARSPIPKPRLAPSPR
ncbi:hypothetical protein GR925_31275 [Streptomyces sp. HUCO-GS316]|uniref:hypothetical protein n=1 Tax=Streptomyces sp. HUCO-GS316 TaxID=2692198 RepID=UPI00136D8DC7|nr:hypothetical protein [Streptomyces sp. HUCO-GS316]MXM67798.1 hypothetical protein [Streptomyces sp. HUCO-GS316]